MTGVDLRAVAAGALGCGYALFYVGRAILSARWPSTLGEIADARFVDRPGDDVGSHAYVAYRYRVNDRPFRNDRVRFGLDVVGPSSRIPSVDDSRDAARSGLAEQYAARAPVRVYYNPRRPEDSVLYRSPHWTVWPTLAIGVLFLYLGLRAAL